MAACRRVAVSFFITLAGAASAAEPLPVVVELFTSQGCNSCPPADAYFAELAHQPGLLTLAFHVDYWNYIGWTDPFAKPWATARQKAYEQSLKERFVYTPQMVVNGEAQGIGSERETIATLISAAKAYAKTVPHPDLALRWREDGALLIEVGAGQSPPRSPADIWLVGFDRPHETHVLRGENEGQTLTDYHVVRSYRRIGGWPGWSLELAVPPEQVAAAGDGGVAVLVQSAGVGPVLAAATIAPH